jgi:hypothetical protein
MAMPQHAFHSPAITLMTPECGTPGCNVAGDQYTMVHCRECKEWFCPDHIAAEEGVKLVCPSPRSLLSLRYYEGSCVPCQQAHSRSYH